MEQIISTITDNAEQTKELAGELAKSISLPAIFAITGQLGAGKTQFVKGLGRGLELDEREICSASFIVIAEYGQSPSLIHIDAYRLEEPGELIDIGWDEIIETRDAIIAIEWPEKIASIMPKNRIDVNIEIIDENRRKIIVTKSGV